MFKTLNAGAIGIHNLSLPDLIVLAGRTGFQGVDFDIRAAVDLVDRHGIDYVRHLFHASNVKPAQWGLPVSWTGDDWQTELTALPRLAAVGRELGCNRTATWCPSWSDTRPYDENFAWHVTRLRPVAEALRDQGCRLGIEFLGPKTLRDGHTYEFIATMDEMLRLAGDIATGNVGLLLDAWHLYSSGGRMADLDRLTPADIVAVHINDAPPDVPRDELRDSVRFLPLETGGIDLVGFMQRLDALGYDGPVTTEPFNARINALAADDPTAAARTVSVAMDRLWATAGLTRRDQ